MSTLTAGDHFVDSLQKGGFRYKAAFLTLTYRDVDGWHPKHVSTFANHLRMWATRRRLKIATLWVAELQKRGAVHYHMVVWLPRGVSLPKPDKQGWWPHGMTKIEWARRPVGYLVKYSSKGDDSNPHPFPRGLRLYGHSALPPDTRRRIRFWKTPRYVREWLAAYVCEPLEALPAWADLIRLRGGGFVDRLTGIAVPPLQPIFTGNNLSFVPRAGHPLWRLHG